MTDTITTAGPQASRPRPLHTRSLSQDLAGLLWTNSDLPQPCAVSVYGDSDHITLQFDPVPSSDAAVAQWAARFGGTVEHHPVTHDRQPCMITRTEFTTYGVEVTVFALIRTSEETGTDE